MAVVSWCCVVVLCGCGCGCGAVVRECFDVFENYNERGEEVEESSTVRLIFGKTT